MDDNSYSSDNCSDKSYKFAFQIVLKNIPVAPNTAGWIMDKPSSKVDRTSSCGPSSYSFAIYGTALNREAQWHIGMSSSKGSEGPWFK